MRTRPLTALLAVLAALLGSLALAAPAHAAEQVVTITADGLLPQVLAVAADDTVAFVNSTALLGLRAQATTENWDLDSGAVLALPGGRYAHPTPITGPGSYGFRVADGEQYVGTVVLRVVPPAPDRAPQAVAAGPGLLDSPPTLRGYGLPSVLAAVLAVGVVSLLVRLLLAEPAARRRPPGLAGPTAVPTVG